MVDRELATVLDYKKMATPDKKDSEAHGWAMIVVSFIEEFFLSLRELLKSLSSAVLIVALLVGGAVWIAYMYRLPDADIDKASPLELFSFFSSVLKSSVFAGTGWLILAAYAPLSWLLFWYMNKRIRSQGAKLSELKDRRAEVRFSSNRPDDLKKFIRESVKTDAN